MRFSCNLYTLTGCFAYPQVLALSISSTTDEIETLQNQLLGLQHSSIGDVTVMKQKRDEMAAKKVRHGDSRVVRGVRCSIRLCLPY